MHLSEQGNSVAVHTLSSARRWANRERLQGRAILHYLHGLADGQLIVANTRLQADRILVQSVDNEIRFLFRDYQREAA